MSAANTPGTFSDTLIFDPNSTPVVDPSLPSVATPPPTTTVVSTQKIVAPVCQINEPPWPTIIISVLGAIVVMYTAIAPGVDENRRIFGVIITILWTVMWALILWVLWKDCHRSATWWLLLVPVALLAVFFILIIVANVGSSI